MTNAQLRAGIEQVKKFANTGYYSDKVTYRDLLTVLESMLSAEGKDLKDICHKIDFESCRVSDLEKRIDALEGNPSQEGCSCCDTSEKIGDKECRGCGKVFSKASEEKYSYPCCDTSAKRGETCPIHGKASEGKQDDKCPFDDYRVIADKIISLGWSSNCDAQWEHIKDWCEEMKTLWNKRNMSVGKEK